mmetsp:Transcript_11541/g.31091  ORF Transcript_11541/g.31091 Transcript_11541/m.31091 type:complete len:258 (+) Transcript_11541:95-868(+)
MSHKPRALLIYMILVQILDIHVLLLKAIQTKNHGPRRLVVEVVLLLLVLGDGTGAGAGARVGEGEVGRAACDRRPLLLKGLREARVLGEARLRDGAAAAAHGLLEVLRADVRHRIVLLDVSHLVVGVFRRQARALHVARDRLADGELGRALADLGEVGARVLVRVGGDVVQVDVFDRRLAQRSLEDREARLEVGHRDVDELVEAARAHQCRVDDVRTVGRANHEHVLLGADAINLGEDLVDHAVGRASAVAARAAAR